jgi:hypothetical protein
MPDPAWYFGVPEEFEQTVYPRRFVRLLGLITQRRAAQAPLDAWYAAVANTRHPSGGVFAEHMGHRQDLDSRVGAAASASRLLGAPDAGAVRIPRHHPAVSSPDPSDSL